jgi:hypothetical protein
MFFSKKGEIEVSRFQSSWSANVACSERAIAYPAYSLPLDLVNITGGISFGMLNARRNASVFGRPIAGHPNLRGNCVSLHAFQKALPVRDLCGFHACGRRHVLIRASF